MPSDRQLHALPVAPEIHREFDLRRSTAGAAIRSFDALWEHVTLGMHFKYYFQGLQRLNESRIVELAINDNWPREAATLRAWIVSSG